LPPNATSVRGNDAGPFSRRVSEEDTGRTAYNEPGHGRRASIMSEERPKIRALDFLPVQVQGRQAFLLRDPQGLSRQEVILPVDMAYLLSQFDGTRTLREAQVNYVRRFGTLLTTDKIEDLLRRLDEALLLESEHFLEFKTQEEAAFRARATRPMTHAGRSYDDGAAAFLLAWQPRLDAAETQGFALDARRPLLIAPHYDMNGAAECYAAAYRLLAETDPPEVVVILGIAHSGGASPFILTRKPFETPFGALEADAAITEALIEAVPFDPLADEFLHRDEHSIEFQAVLLHFLYCRDADPPKIVPILCGGYHRQGGEVVNPGESGPAAQFLASLRELLAADSRRIALIASADLCHIGARFGQPPLTQVHLDLARRHDMSLLEKAQAGDAAGLYQTLAQEGDRYNVCGFPAIYALVSVATPSEGHLLSYRQFVEPQTQSAVSFASVALR